jgi:formyl-CoA transferase
VSSAPSASDAAPGAAPFGALQGLTVIDLTRMLSGPFATMMLADQGARVIKIEPPGGDATRRTGPHLPGSLVWADGGFGAYFASTNRNKLSLTLDLKTAEGRAVLHRLVAQADVLVENYRAGVMDRLGLGYEKLAAENPRLVYAALRGFGDPRSGRSPYVDWPAYDPVAQAMGGIMGITGPVPGGAPTKIGPGVGDIIPAMYLAFAVASACWHAQRTGKGQFVDVAMVDAILALCERPVYQYSATGQPPGPEGNGHPLLCPFGLFPARDGYVSLSAPNDKFWELLAKRMGRPELATDPRYATGEARNANRDEVEAIVSAWTSARDKSEISAALGGEIPFGAVLDAADIFADPHFRQRQMLVDVEQPGADRPLTVANTPVRMSRTPGGVQRRAPLVGEHSDDVLASFGFTPDEISALRAAKALG